MTKGRSGEVARWNLVAGTIFCVCLLFCGCTTHRSLELDADNPAVRVSVHGILFEDEHVEPTEVAEILEDYDVPYERVIYIALDSDVKDLRPARYLMACLAKAGYTSSVLVTKRHAESVNLGKKRQTTSSAPNPEKKRVIRYKKASE